MAGTSDKFCDVERAVPAREGINDEDCVLCYAPVDPLLVAFQDRACWDVTLRTHSIHVPVAEGQRNRPTDALRNAGGNPRYRK